MKRIREKKEIEYNIRIKKNKRKELDYKKRKKERI